MPHADDRRQAEVGAEAAKRKERDILKRTKQYKGTEGEEEGGRKETRRSNRTRHSGEEKK